MLEIDRPTDWVALTGFMGVGKSRIGRELAREMMLHFIDLDRYIERQTGLSIPDIFRHLGEPTFRQLESEAVAELVQKDYLVLSLAGAAADPLQDGLGAGPKRHHRAAFQQPLAVF